MKTFVVLPTYNEAENLPGLISSLLALDTGGIEVLIVDDNSPDGTGQVAERLTTQHPGRVHVLHRSGKQGLGTAYIAGFHYALAQGADYIVQMDADFSHSPSYVPIMLEEAKTVDVVIGSRYVAGGGVDANWSPWRRLLSWWGNAVYSRLVLGLRVHDTTNGFRCFRRRVLESLDLGRIRSQGYVFQVEMAYACQKKGFSMREIPIIFPDRARGKSKMSVWVGLEAAWRIWQFKWRY